MPTSMLVCFWKLQSNTKAVVPCGSSALRGYGEARHNIGKRTSFTKVRKRLEGLLSLESQSWLTLENNLWLPLIQCLVTLSPRTSARGVPHYFLRNCHAQSKEVFSPNKKITIVYKSRHTQNKITSRNYAMVYVYSYVCAHLRQDPSRLPQAQPMKISSVDANTRRHLKKRNDAQKIRATYTPSRTK